MGRGLTQRDWNYAQTKRRDKVYVYVYLYIYLDMLKIRSIRNAVAEWKIVSEKNGLWTAVSECRTWSAFSPLLLNSWSGEFVKLFSDTKHAEEAVVGICFDKLCESHGCELSQRNGAQLYSPPENRVKGGWAERKMMDVKEGFLTLLYLTLDMKNATWVWNHVCDQGKSEFWISVLIAQAIQF